MTWRAIWTPPGTPFPEHSDHESEAEAHAAALRDSRRAMERQRRLLALRGRCGMRRALHWLRWHSLRAHIIAPIWVRIPEKHRWTVVHWLNKSRRKCWCDLVSDALCNREDDACDISIPVLRGERAPRCATVCDWMHPDHVGEHDCACYCGKFQFRAPDGANERKEWSA